MIGGVAGNAHGSPLATFDLDICYERSPENHQALARALQLLHATARGLDPTLPFKLDATTLLLGDHFTFSTDEGSLDCLGTPSGTQGYPDLVRTAVDYPVKGMVVKVASLDDLIRMKRAAGRPKDLLALEFLGALRAEADQEPE